jgi:hypothetical protein
VGASALGAVRGSVQPFDCLEIEALGGVAGAEQRLAARFDTERPVGATGPGALRQLLECLRRVGRLVAPDCSLDQLNEYGVGGQVEGRAGGAFRCDQCIFVASETVVEGCLGELQQLDGATPATGPRLVDGGGDDGLGLRFLPAPRNQDRAG